MLAAGIEGKFVELEHPPGYGQVDFGKMRVFLGRGIASNNVSHFFVSIQQRGVLCSSSK